MNFFAEKHYPDYLAPEELDTYLARGWYRMGQTIFTTHFLCFNEQLYSAIWIRLNLANHKYRKGQRRLLRRNSERFTIQYTPFRITPAKEQLFLRYKKSFKGYLGRSLRESLLDNEEDTIYNTYEVQIFDEDRLVGLSFFDLGKDSAASITGIYDPDYSEYSLGYYSMLLEMEYCQAQGLSYYYPGYVVPGYERFDYKLRIGEVEYLALHDFKWHSYQQLTAIDTPIANMEQKLRLLGTQLEELGIPYRLYQYPLFEASLFGFWDAPYLEYPWLLQVREGNPKFTYFVVYNIRTSKYELLRCTAFDDLNFYFNEAYTRLFDPSKFMMELSVVDGLLASMHAVDDFALHLQMYQHRFI